MPTARLSSSRLCGGRWADRVVGRLRWALTWVRSFYGGMVVLADTRSRLRFLRLKRERRRREPAPADAAVPLQVKELGGHPFHLRPGTSDTAMVAYDFYYGHGRPPRQLHDLPLRRLVELGSNIGGCLVDLAARYSDARLLGVEADPDNVAVVRRNTAPWGDRISVVEAAIWDSDGEVTVEPDSRARGKYGLIVRSRREDDPPELPSIRALSLNTVLREFEPSEPIDYIYMDIAGTEDRVLQNNTKWAERVRALRVVIEPDREWGTDECARALERLGFETWTERASLHGLRQRSSLGLVGRVGSPPSRSSTSRRRTPCGIAFGRSTVIPHWGPWRPGAS